MVLLLLVGALAVSGTAYGSPGTPSSSAARQTEASREAAGGEDWEWPEGLLDESREASQEETSQSAVRPEPSGAEASTRGSAAGEDEGPESGTGASSGEESQQAVPGVPGTAGTEVSGAESAGTETAGTETAETETAASDPSVSESGEPASSEPGAGEGEAKAAGSILPIVLGILVVAAVAAAAVWIFLRKKNGGGSYQPAGEPLEGSGGMRQQMSGGPGAAGDAAPGSFQSAPYPVMIGNAHHIGGRESQQDSFGISDITDRMLCQRKGILAVVADGMGGLSDGAAISGMITSCMLQDFASGAPVSDPALELLSMVSRANGQVNRYLAETEGQSGSTVVAVWIQGPRLYFISVGDSRIYLLRGGALTQLNREHTYGAELDELAALGKISLEEARENDQRHALTSYIGMGEVEHIDRSMHPLHLEPGDKVLLMSDGVFGTVPDPEIARLAGPADAFTAARNLEQAVLAAGKPGQDNFTAVVLEYMGEAGGAR